jgi:hypothetical protein
MLRDRMIVQPRARRDGDLAGVESRIEDVIGTGGEGLNPFEVLHAGGGILEVGGRVGPGD